MQTIPQRLNALRAAMAARGIDAYVIPTSDFHASEYVGAHFKTRAYFSGFTGSAGTLILTERQAALWTDGRYFLQASEDLQGSGITLMRVGEPGVPTVPEYLAKVLPACGVLGADARTLGARECLDWLSALSHKGVTLCGGEDVAGTLWLDRPPLPTEPAFALPVAYAGQSAADKLAALRTAIQAAGAGAHILATLDDIAWLFNIRGGDIAFNPVVLSFAVIEQNRAFLFIDEKKLSGEIADALTGLGVTLKPYCAVYDFVADYQPEEKVLLDPKAVNYALYARLQAQIIEGENPAKLMKAVKNPTEQENLRKAHVKDGVAVCKLIYWLKTQPDVAALTECAVAEKMNALRQEQVGCVGPSFTTIAGYGPHGAIVHYHPTKESDIHLKPEGLLLLDSGGQYFEGTTDITRTIALGPVSDEARTHFSLVLRGMLALSAARFPAGVSGFHLDAIAREPLWQRGLDFQHGTGHGIGYMLCVHEGPAGIRYKRTERDDAAPFQAGMVTSDEPGMYVAGSHGVRIENQLLCKAAAPSPYGEFLEFETLTLAPIDYMAIDPATLGEEGVSLLNAYHQRVYDVIGPLLTKEEQEWLFTQTRPV